MSTEHVFEFRIEGTIFLTVSEIWPDGDAPPAPTAEDVIDSLQITTLPKFLRDWGLNDYLELTVDGKPGW